MENSGFYIEIIWCLVIAGALFGRSKTRRQTISPLFHLYLPLALSLGLALSFVGFKAAGGSYPECGALVALLGICAGPVVLMSFFLAPARLALPATAFLILWNIFTTAGMFATANGCPPWISMLECAAGVALVGSSIAAWLQAKNWPKVAA